MTDELINWDRKSSSIILYHTQSLFGISKIIIDIFLQFAVVRTGADELDVDKKCSGGDMDRCNQITAWHHLLARVPKCFISERGQTPVAIFMV